MYFKRWLQSCYTVYKDKKPLQLLKIYTNISIEMFIFFMEFKKKWLQNNTIPFFRPLSCMWQLVPSWNTFTWLPWIPSLWFFSPIIGLSFISSSPCLLMLEHSTALTSFLLYPHAFSRARWADRKSCGLNNLWLKIPKYLSPAWTASLNSRLSYLAVPFTRPPGWLSISKLTCPKQFLNLPSKPVLPVTQVKNLEVTLDLAFFSHTT